MFRRMYLAGVSCVKNLGTAEFKLVAGVLILGLPAAERPHLSLCVGWFLCSKTVTLCCDFE